MMNVDNGQALHAWFAVEVKRRQVQDLSTVTYSIYLLIARVEGRASCTIHFFDSPVGVLTGEFYSWVSSQL